MKRITFTVHSVSSSDELYTRNILIGKPKVSIVFSFDEEELDEMEIQYIDQLVCHIKAERCVEELLCEYGMENFSLKTTYIKQSNYLLGLEKNKLLDEVFAELQTNHLKFVHFYVGGGGSFECNGYRFVVHSDEAVHRNMPHVHVVKDDESVRYSLVTLERIDRCSRSFLRDEKKKIKPALEKYLPQLREYWTAAMNGYRPPEFDFHGKQYYPES